MKILCDSSEEEMMAWFLRAELDSSRHGEKLRGVMKLVGAGEDFMRDVSRISPEDHQVRMEINSKYREYWGDFLLRMGKKIVWQWAELDPKEYEQIRLAAPAWLDELSENTRNVEVAAKNVAKLGREDWRYDFIWQTVDSIDAGNLIAPQIVYEDPELGFMRFIEGNGRAISYALANTKLQLITIILGRVKHEE